MSTSISPQCVRWVRVSVRALVCVCARVLSTYTLQMTQEAELWTWIYPHCHYRGTLTPTVVICDKWEGVVKKKMGFRCDNYYICLLVPPYPLPPPLQTCCLCAILLTSSSVDWHRWGTGGQELNCMQHVAMSEFDIAPYLLSALAGGWVFVAVVYLFVLPVSFKGYNIKVLNISCSHWDAIGCALSCPQMLSHSSFHSRD